MEITEALELLKQKSEEAVYIASLPYRNSEYIIWRRNTEDILETTFGVSSTEYKRIANIHTEVTGTRQEIQRRYRVIVHRIQLEIISIIQKIEILGTEERPATTDITPPRSPAEVAIQLFNGMKLHPDIVTASKSLFETQHYAQAIFEAFKAVENFVQDKSDLKIYGTNLMEEVFNEENPIIKVPEAGHYYKDVQRGFKHLFIGAAKAIRNPKAHKGIIQKDPYITLEYLGFASFLLKRIDYWDSSLS